MKSKKQSPTLQFEKPEKSVAMPENLPPITQITPANDSPKPAETAKDEKATAVPNKPLAPIDLFVNQITKYQNTVLYKLLSSFGMEPDRFVQVVIDEVKRSPKLLDAFKANPSSMFASILAGAEIGLVPSSLIGEFYLIPRSIGGTLTVTPLIGYKGVHNIIMRSGQITKVHSEVVFDGDEFTPIYGLEPNIIHKPNFDVPRKSANIKYVYAVAKLSNGDFQFVVLTRDEIMGIKGKSRYDNDLYFNDKDDPMHWMVRKTAIIQLSKLLPKDFHGKKAIELDNKLTGGAVLTLDENNQIVIKESADSFSAKGQNKTKFPTLRDTFASLPEIKIEDDNVG